MSEANMTAENQFTLDEAEDRRLAQSVSNFLEHTEKHGLLGERQLQAATRGSVMEGIPRRARVDLWIPAERAINDALQAVEALGAHPDLTAVVIKLSEAQDAIADWHDGGRPGGVPIT